MGIKVPTSSQGGMDEINVTPLIDVVLVLLIIFMVMTPVTVRKLASNLPPQDMDEPIPPDTPPDQLMVAVYGDGKISLNLKEGTDADLMDEVSQRLRSKAKKTVFIDAAPDANYGRVVQVMDLVRTAGAETVGLADLKDDGPARLLPGQAMPVATPPGDPGTAGAAALPNTPE